ncbi:MAG TPA: IS982 family transposase, partial [Actinomycetota bacterium]
MTDAGVVTLCVAQAIMGITSDPRFIAVAAKRLAHLFPRIPKRSGFYKRRERLSDTIEALIDEFARHSAGYTDTVLLVDSTPVETCRSRETV